MSCKKWEIKTYQTSQTLLQHSLDMQYKQNRFANYLRGYLTLILTSSTIDKKLENFEFIFEFKIAINFEFIFEIFVNFEFNFEIFVNFEFIFEFLSISSFLLRADEVTTRKNVWLLQNCSFAYLCCRLRSCH